MYYLRFLPYEQAREFVRKQGLKNQKEWKDFSKSDRKPDYIPAPPHKVYRGKGWTNLGDWLGTGILAPKDRDYWPFEKAREFARSSGIISAKEWFSASKNGELPAGIPSDPSQKYEDEGWINWSDWLGTGRIADRDKEYWDYKTARDFVHKLGLKDENEWYSYCKSGNKPPQIPTAVRKTYKDKGWKGMGDWLGTDTIANQERKHLSFEKAREYAQSLGLKTTEEWRNFTKSGKLLKSIPADPAKVYKDIGWKGMGDWLGTGRIAPKDTKSLPFEEARDYAHSLQLKSKTEWEQHCRSGNLRNGIPTHPDREYQVSDWISWGDWLGTGRIADQERGWSIDKIKELLRSLIESRVIYQWSEARLYAFLLTKGVLNLRYENRHSQFFKKLIEASRTEGGRRVIEEYAYSNSQVVPDLLNEESDIYENEIKSASSEELARLVNDEGDPLDYGKIPTVGEVLASTYYLNQ